jgi:hypothetical protein
MSAPILAIVDFSRWETWLVASAAFTCAALLLTLARTVFGARRLAPTAEVGGETGSDPFVTGSASERRASLRRRGREVKVAISNDQADATPMEGWIMDRSTGGLCIGTRHELKVGKVISIRPSEGPVTVPWVQAEVRYCRKHKGGWDVGCAFVKTPPWSILLHFG